MSNAKAVKRPATGKRRPAGARPAGLQVLLIRHAEAEDREKFTGPDLERALTRKGRRRFRADLKRIRRILPGPGRILASQARRARETARIVAKVLGAGKPRVVRGLNPGAAPAAIARAIRAARARVVAVVGHEPDLSGALAAWLGVPAAAVAMKKGAVAWLAAGPAMRGAVLRGLFPPARGG